MADADDIAAVFEANADKLRAEIMSADLSNVSDVIAVTLGNTERSARQLTGRVSWEINRAANEARSDEMRVLNETRSGSTRLQKLWIAERDACVHCLGLHGEVVDEGQDFDHDASFDPNGSIPVFENHLPHPPRHPYCRCRVTSWSPSYNDNSSGVSYPEALRREAERSIAKGYALPGEAAAPRLRAAQDLVSGRNRLPRSVNARARKKLVAGDDFLQPLPAPPPLGQSGRVAVADIDRALDRVRVSTVPKLSAAEQKRAARRRAYAAQKVETEALEAAAVDRVGSTAYYQARQELRDLRDEVKDLAQKAESDLVDDLPFKYLARPPKAVRRTDPITGRTSYVRPGAGGEWDWFDQLSDVEKRQVRGYFPPGTTTGGTSPDQLAQLYGVDSVDEAAERFLEQIRDRDTLRAAALGRQPSGSVDAALARAGARLDTPLEGRDLDLDDLLAATEVDAAEMIADGTIRELGRYADDAFMVSQPMTQNPRAYAMSASEYADELASVNARLSEYGPVTPSVLAEFETLPTELQFLIARRAELVPGGIGLEGLDVASAWARIRMIADEAVLD